VRFVSAAGKDAEEFRQIDFTRDKAAQFFHGCRRPHQARWRFRRGLEHPGSRMRRHAGHRTALARAAGRSRRRPVDFVTIEIGTALAMGERVIPVLVGGASIPRANELPEAIQPFAHRNEVGLRPECFATDCQGLVTALKEQLVDTERERAARTEGGLRARGEAIRQSVPRSTSMRPTGRTPPRRRPELLREERNCGRSLRTKTTTGGALRNAPLFIRRENWWGRLCRAARAYPALSPEM